VKTKVNGVLEKSKNPFNGHKMSRGWRMKELANLIDRKRDVWSCKSKVLQGSNHTSIPSCVFRTQRFTVLHGLLAIRWQQS
jgi:hypothetical protein